MLFPVSDSPDADPENLGKAFLGELEFFACGSYIHSRDFDDMPFAARFVTTPVSPDDSVSRPLFAP